MSSNNVVATEQVDPNEPTVVYVGGLFTPLVPAILKYAVKQNASPFVKAHITETLNWGITLLLVNIALTIVATILAKIFAPLAMIVSLVSLAMLVAHIYFTLFKGMQAMKRGEAYRYPIALRLIKD